MVVLPCISILVTAVKEHVVYVGGGINTQTVGTGAYHQCLLELLHAVSCRGSEFYQGPLLLGAACERFLSSSKQYIQMTDVSSLYTSQGWRN